MKKKNNLFKELAILLLILLLISFTIILFTPREFRVLIYDHNGNVMNSSSCEVNGFRECEILIEMKQIQTKEMINNESNIK